MAILIRCHSCQKKLRVADRKAGGKVRCPNCGSDVPVPEGSKALSEAPDSVSAGAPSSRAEHWFSRPVGDVAALLPTEPITASALPPRSLELPQRDEDDEGVPFRRGRVEVEEMDLTPMVDMTFLLLIFFMITASFSLQKTIQVPVPDPEKQGQVESQQEIEDLLDRSVRVDIDAQGVIRVDDEVIASRSTLAETIRDKSIADRRTELILIPDPQAKHELVVAVVDAAHAAGMQKIRLSSARVNAD